ncbi:PDZ/DHR/GLGF domain protein [Ancylostoma ceylanicum]|uniref:PDZ/DHR/GLGF domain protein n=1 Tax=Ancylostoma ceylanicum TaxID=53326 RepID=A0A0D6LES3_9BILA|nr:PDZ/DHR/GLGF domain protein [Ancylostoma ceylanicum]
MKFPHIPPALGHQASVRGKDGGDRNWTRDFDRDRQGKLEKQKKQGFSRNTKAIYLFKDGKGLGLSIVGGSDTVLGTVVIHEVYPDGAAAHDGRLKPGDQVLEVRLLIYRDVNLQLSLLDPTQIYNMFEVELVKKPGRGLGLSIVGRKNEPGVYVSEVVKGGAAEADNRLMTGDQVRILAVNGQDVANSMQEDVAAMLKTCVGRVCLKVSCTFSFFGADDSRTSATVSERKDVPSPAPPLRPIITHTSPEGEAVAEADVHLSPVTEEPSSGADQIPDQQLGMGIGKRSRGILVTSLQPGSAAAEKLKVGDRILAVNALPVTDQVCFSMWNLFCLGKVEEMQSVCLIYNR